MVIKFLSSSRILHWNDSWRLWETSTNNSKASTGFDKSLGSNTRAISLEDIESENMPGVFPFNKLKHGELSVSKIVKKPFSSNLKL